jgi:vancomycin permeability regulator SanA
MLVIVLALGLVANAYVAAATYHLRYRAEGAVPLTRVAIVFGAGIRPDGRLSRILADRVDAAIALYQQGRVQKLLMTGDNSRVDYDEVSAMRRYALTRGVAAADITRDYAGFRTYDSCFRARAIFGVTEAVLVTQRYHLPRAVYTCRALGVAAVGVGTPDWGAYHPLLIARYQLREAIATVVALGEVHLTRPLPRFLGRFEGLGEGTRPRATISLGDASEGTPCMQAYGSASSC